MVENRRLTFDVSNVMSTHGLWMHRRSAVTFRQTSFFFPVLNPDVQNQIPHQFAKLMQFNLNYNSLSGTSIGISETCRHVGLMCLLGRQYFVRLQVKGVKRVILGGSSGRGKSLVECFLVSSPSRFGIMAAEVWAQNGLWNIYETFN